MRLSTPGRAVHASARDRGARRPRPAGCASAVGLFFLCGFELLFLAALFVEVQLDAVVEMRFLQHLAQVAGAQMRRQCLLFVIVQVVLFGLVAARDAERLRAPRLRSLLLRSALVPERTSKPAPAMQTLFWLPPAHPPSSSCRQTQTAGSRSETTGSTRCEADASASSSAGEASSVCRFFFRGSNLRMRSSIGLFELRIGFEARALLSPALKGFHLVGSIRMRERRNLLRTRLPVTDLRPH